MRRKPQSPKLNEKGYETHPAWGLIGASRVSSGGRGATLFDSDIQHQHFVMVRLSRAERRRNLMHDYKHGSEQIVEIAMSEAQWASFVSTMNVGQGVPCTIESIGRKQVPGVEYEPRLAVSMEEVQDAATQALKQIQEALDDYLDHKTVKKLRTLEMLIRNAPANMRFAADSLSEHAENVVQRARADIEAMVVSKAEQLGIDPADITTTPLLDNPDKE